MKLRVLLAAAAGAVAAACSDSPSGPGGTPNTPAQSFRITCPAPVAAESTTGSPVSVTYTPPTITAGKTPVVTTCTPASGSTFNLGSTSVNCLATDGTPQTISCAFPVNVTRPGLLSSTKFLAFGDSITAGSLSQCSSLTTASLTPREFFLRDLAMIRAAINVPTSYPAVLTTQLLARYGSQSPAATNVGVPGERVSDNTWGTNDVTMDRLRSEMTAFLPQIVLLMEGVNDLNANVQNPQVTAPAVVKGLRDLAREARQRGAQQVFIGTLTPQTPGGCRAVTVNQIAGVNDQIRQMVAADRHVLVDVFNGFGGVPGSFMGPDGLHPNVLGYQRIAQIFFDKIKETLEVPR